MTEIDEKQRRIIDRLKTFRGDFPMFAREHLLVRPKNPEDPLVPFILNRPQQYIHERLEEQRAATGRVRAMILKGRQQGASTYIGGRYYHRASLFKGIHVYILSHEQTASESLFEMVERYHRHNELAPKTGTSNVRELEFERLGSKYTVATAKTKAGGRGKTPTLFHGSEVAFWENAKDHFAASIQGIPDAPGTEIVLESTANGASGEFYDRWQKAEAGIGDYIAIFVPWFWSEEYSRPVPAGFELSTEKDDAGMSEVEYASFYGLTMGQMVWRRAKIEELGKPSLFRQEYPATASEAFQNSDDNTFIKPTPVLRARKNKDVCKEGPLVMGVDPAGGGGDRFSIATRYPYAVDSVKWRDKLEILEAVEWVADEINKRRPGRVNIDAGGIGAAVISLLRAREDIDSKIIRAVNFGSPSQSKKARPKMPGPVNRRAEMWGRSRDWLDLEEGVSIPDMEVLQTDATAPRVEYRINNDFILESKDKMKKRGARSPDLWDSIALTFADSTPIKSASQPTLQHEAAPPVMNEAPKTAAPREKYRRGLRNGWMAS